MTEKTQRRLVAIVSSDVVDYSRLMGTDEAGTLAAMQAHRNELWDPTIEKFGGRIVGTAGDSVLIEYTSAVAGVEAAIAVQRGMITRNGDLPDERRMMLRIGVNIGEVIVADEDIFGDGVNVAARLQALSDTGGIAISDNVHEQVRGRLEVAFSDDGEHEVKNIDRPVHVWRWSPTEQQAVTVTGIHGSDLDRSKLALPSIGELKFLIVDDEEFVRILITRILNNLGASNIDSADNGATALDRLDEMEGEADVILCDLNMPGMDGVEFLRHLSDRGFVGGLALMNDRGGRILDTAQTLAQAHKLNLFGSLEKPVMPQDLVELLEGYVANASRSKHIANAQVTEDELKRAIEADEMIVFFQPKVSVATGEVVGVESLIRWNHPESGIIAPGMFIPAAENYGLIDKLTDVVFLKSMVQGGHWWSEGHDMKISVNISVDSLHRLDLPEIVASQAMSQGLDPSAVILEVTESRLMTDLTASLEILTRIRMQDIGLSIDDFGTGFSSLEQLTRVPFNELKIDQAFVTGATNDPTARAILESSVDLARKLELTIVAEGVETQEDLDLIASLGVDIAQGYFIAKPTPAGDEFDLILQSLGERKIKGIAQPAQSRGAPIDSTRDNAESASTAKLAYGSEQSTTSALLDKPSIAVLPFDNMSDDPEQEYFADGMTEDIITGLSTWRWLPVIARNSTFTYKGQAVDVKRVGHDLGARYVLEGSVRKAGNRVRITGQLIDVESGAHVWAERYDRELVDIFDLQDEITESIVQNIMPEISQAEIERASRVPPANLDAWEYLQRGLWHAYRYTREDNEIAKEFLVGALERDPTLALAAAWRAGANLLDVLFGWTESPEESLLQALEYCHQAIALNAQEFLAHATLAGILPFLGQAERGYESGQRAVDLNPSSSLAHYCRAVPLVFMHRNEEALEGFETAIRFSPRDPMMPFYLGSQGLAHLMLRDFDESIASARRGLREQPDNVRALHRLAIAEAHKGNHEAARAAYAESELLLPAPSLEYFTASYPFTHSEDLDFFFDGIRIAGWKS